MTPDPKRLRTLLTPDWSVEREDAVLRRLREAERSTGSRRWIVASAGIAAAAVLVVVLMGGRDEPVPPTPVGPIAEASPEPERVASPEPVVSLEPSALSTVVPLQFRDGSAVVPDDVDSDLIIAEAGEYLTRVELRRGGARFDVTPNPERQFRVEAGLVTVDVLGTEFHCRRGDDEVTVEVIRGRVSVSWPGGSRILARGQMGVFPPPPTKTSPERRSPASSSALHWRRLAGKGDSAAAYEALRAGEKVANRAEELMLASDVARKAGHPEAALPYLRRIMEDHPNDSRTPLAAFTSGRIEQGLGNYRSAAKHFAAVRKMEGSSLVEHALAREISAWAAAGDESRAKRRAKDYLARYPDGPRAEQVRRILASANE